MSFRLLRGGALLCVLHAAACGVGSNDPAPTPPAPEDEWDQKLDDRVVDYGAALRIAALRLTGDLPTLTEMTSVVGAADPKSAYGAQVKLYMDSPKFAAQMFHWWQDTLKMGDTPELDSAAAFAAQVTVTNRPYTDLFTATSGTCPTFDETTGAFTAANCTNGAPATAGLLTHPGAMAQFFGNLAFRRVRWVQEVFACTAFPAQISTTGQDVGGATQYIGVFPYATALATTSNPPAATDGRVDFRNVSAQVCANCHSNINHIAPLFAHFDEQGQYSANIVVPTPLVNNPVAVLTDYLPPGEPTQWRMGVMAPDLTTLGQDMAKDPEVTSCVINRMWNWAMGKSDIVDQGNRVPADTIATIDAAFGGSGYKLKDAIYQIFTSDDFTRF
ncbi:MAG TPA: hypothetical protein VGC41_10785 [Kofleriaceae bacterium]